MATTHPVAPKADGLQRWPARGAALGLTVVAIGAIRAHRRPKRGVIVHDKHPPCVCHLEGLLKIAAQFKLLLHLFMLKTEMQ